MSPKVSHNGPQRAKNGLAPLRFARIDMEITGEEIFRTIKASVLNALHRCCYTCKSNKANMFGFGHPAKKREECSVKKHRYLMTLGLKIVLKSMDLGLK